MMRTPTRGRESPPVTWINCVRTVALVLLVFVIPYVVPPIVWGESTTPAKRAREARRMLVR